MDFHNVLYVSKICKNLMPKSLLNKHDSFIMFESDKVRIFSNEDYVSNWLFKLNIMAVKFKMNKSNFSNYLCKFSICYMVDYVDCDIFHILN